MGDSYTQSYISWESQYICLGHFSEPHMLIYPSHILWYYTFFRCHFCSPPFVPRWRWLPGPHWRAATTVATPHSAPWTATRPASGRRTARRRATRRESTLGYPSRHMAGWKTYGEQTRGYIYIYMYIYIYVWDNFTMENERDQGMWNIDGIPINASHQWIIGLPQVGRTLEIQPHICNN